MRAIVVDRWMEPAEIAVRELPDPVVGAGQLGIDVKAAGCNFFDILIVQGKYQVKPPFPFIPGGEVSGMPGHNAAHALLEVLRSSSPPTGS